MHKKSIVLLLLLFAVSCLPKIQPETGTKFDVNKFNQITAGSTTKENLYTSLGQPQATGLNEKGKEKWTYFYLAIDYKSRCILLVTPLDVRYQYMELNLTFDGNTVSEKSYQTTKEIPK